MHNPKMIKECFKVSFDSDIMVLPYFGCVKKAT